MPRQVALIAALLCAPFVSPAQAANLISNGSFEQGLLGWTVTGAVQVRSDETPSDGLYEAVFNWGNVPGSGLIRQQFATQVGQTYHFEFDYGAFADPKTQSIGYSVNGLHTLLSGVLTDIGSVPTTWLTYRGSFVADSASTIIYFRDFTSATQSIASDLVLDRVLVEAVVPPAPVPEPGTLALFSGGLMALALRRRQARPTRPPEATPPQR